MSELIRKLKASSYVTVIKYGSVGVFNTGLHAFIFVILIRLNFDQATANLIAFSIAVSFSYFINAIYTFNAKVSAKGYLKMSIFMAMLSYIGGRMADIFSVHYGVTFVVWCIFSFIVGFVFNKLFVFCK